VRLLARPAEPTTGTVPGHDLSEREAVSAARSGDRAAIASLYERHAAMIHAVLLAKVGRQDAEDLVQDVFLRAMSKLETLKDRDAIAPWLVAIARNLAADAGRARERAARLRLVATESDCRPPADAAQEVDRVLEAIRDLPEAYRETLMLRLVERLTGPQIAERLGLTHGSVRVNLCRGMKLLRERLGLDGEA
jgi:RNA polymerase sigma-70 factor (ECF subfamily)